MHIKFNKDITEATLGRLDLVFDSDQTTSEYLTDAVYMSMFCDKRVEDDRTEVGGYRGGWWANTDLGSYLWTLYNEKDTTDLAARAKRYIEDSLSWMISDGLADSVSATTSFEGDQLKAVVSISKNNIGLDLPFKNLWTATIE
jgi:phage gp46-like protein